MDGDDDGVNDAPKPDRHNSVRDAAAEAFSAALEAEEMTGRVEHTEAEAKRGVVIRLARTVGGFLLIGVGLAGLALPGPGWLVIILGLSLLPYAWAQRTIREIRRRIPGVPEDGRIPVSTWIWMGLLLGAAALITVFFGAEISKWIAGLWGDPNSLFG